MSTKFKKIVISTTSAAIGGVVGSWVLRKEEDRIPYEVNLSGYNRADSAKPILPQRPDQLKRLQRGDEFDVLIIGGGATGVGCAVDAVTRGLKTALVEANDFASRTSSKSTKLIHGGIRYLETAIWKLDPEQYNIVREALSERAIMLNIAPHLTRMIPIMIPLYTRWEIPYYWIGLKIYDLLAGRKNFQTSHFLSKKAAVQAFPLLDDKNLTGAVCYYDGQQDDARMCLSLAITAARYGATVCNYVEVTKLVKKQDKEGTVLSGARVKDVFTGKEFNVKAKCIINATGPFTDEIRKMDDPSCKNICTPSAGTHITLPSYYSPKRMGFLIPNTSDGRVVFCLRWQHHTVAGTTDMPCKVKKNPIPTETEILFIIKELKQFLKADVRRSDVLSAWSGIRPLVLDPSKTDTKSIARNHLIIISPTKLVTIAGGKWTTYRAMAKQTINEAIQCCNLKPTANCITEYVKVEGANKWSPTICVQLAQEFGIDSEIARHLARAYGDRAFNVIRLASLTGKSWPLIGKRLYPDYPYIEAEVRYGVREYACTAIDIIARRTRLAFLNTQAAEESLIRIIDIMSEELNWSEAEKLKQHKMALDFLSEEMGLGQQNHFKIKTDIILTNSEISNYTERFKYIDKDNKGYVFTSEIFRFYEESGESDLSYVLDKMDTKLNDKIELNEFLKMMAAVKSDQVDQLTDSSLEDSEEDEYLKRGVSVERSGGGL